MSSASASFNELLGVLSEALPECFNRERADACDARDEVQRERDEARAERDDLFERNGELAAKVRGGAAF